MGIVFVLLLWAVAGVIGAFGSALVLVLTVRFVLRHAPAKRKRATAAAAMFPFACLAFAAMLFVVVAMTNTLVRHRDPGMGDDWYTPLPNGYALDMIDVIDQGRVFNPSTQPYKSSSNQGDEVHGTRQLQVAGKLIYGARDTNYFEHLGQESNAIDKYFELDTAEHTYTELDTIDALRNRAESRGVTLKLEPIYSVYVRYRFTWFDYLADAILVLVPSAGFFLLARWVWRIRRLGESQSPKSMAT